MMRFSRAVEISACGMSSDCSFAGQKHVADFYVFYFGEAITRGKHVVQTADQSAQTCEKVDRKKVKQNGGLFDSIKFSVLSLTLLHKLQTPCDSSREKRFILALGA